MGTLAINKLDALLHEIMTERPSDAEQDRLNVEMLAANPPTHRKPPNPISLPHNQECLEVRERQMPRDDTDAG